MITQARLARRIIGEFEDGVLWYNSPAVRTYWKGTIGENFKNYSSGTLMPFETTHYSRKSTKRPSILVWVIAGILQLRYDITIPSANLSRHAFRLNDQILQIHTLSVALDNIWVNHIYIRTAGQLLSLMSTQIQTSVTVANQNLNTRRWSYLNLTQSPLNYRDFAQEK